MDNKKDTFYMVEPTHIYLHIISVSDSYIRGHRYMQSIGITL